MNQTTVASGYSGAGNSGHHGTTAMGTAGNTTAGPHDSSLLNKLDPRVDSDRDGSKTMGGNAGTSNR